MTNNSGDTKPVFHTFMPHGEITTDDVTRIIQLTSDGVIEWFQTSLFCYGLAGFNSDENHQMLFAERVGLNLSAMRLAWVQDDAAWLVLEGEHRTRGEVMYERDPELMRLSKELYDLVQQIHREGRVGRFQPICENCGERGAKYKFEWNPALMPHLSCFSRESLQLVCLVCDHITPL